MHERRGAHHPSPVGLSDALVSKADAQDGQLTGKLTHDLETDPRVLGSSRTRGDDQRVGARVPDAVYVDGVVAVHHRLRPELAQLLDEVVGEGVVVVYEQDTYGHRATMVVPTR